MYVYLSFFVYLLSLFSCYILKIIISFVMRYSTRAFFSLHIVAGVQLLLFICYTTSGQFEMLSLGIILSVPKSHLNNNVSQLLILCKYMYWPPQVIGDCHVTYVRKHHLSHSLPLFALFALSIRLSLLINVRNILMTAPVFLPSMLTNIAMISVRYDV